MEQAFNLTLKNRKLIVLFFVLIFLGAFLFGNILFLIHQKKVSVFTQKAIMPANTFKPSITREIIHEGVVYHRKPSCSGGSLTNKIE